LVIKVYVFFLIKKVLAFFSKKRPHNFWKLFKKNFRKIKRRKTLLTFTPVRMCSVLGHPRDDNNTLPLAVVVCRLLESTERYSCRDILHHHMFLKGFCRQKLNYSQERRELSSQQKSASSFHIKKLIWSFFMILDESRFWEWDRKESGMSFLTHFEVG